MRSTCLLLRGLMLAMACGSGAAVASPGSQPLVVRAVVLARTNVQVASAPARLQVSPRDVARGFVDAEHPVTLSVHSNVASGVMLDFLCAGGVAVRALVARNEGGAPSGSPLLLPWQRHPHQVVVRVRFLLSPDATPGDYPWPLRVSAAA